jgi:two-component system LytT family sensor kinase
MIKEKILSGLKFQKNGYRKAPSFYIHLVIWIAYFLYENGNILLLYPQSFFLKSSALYFSLNAIFFYANYYLVSAVKIDGYRHIKRIGIFILLSITYLCLTYMMMLFIHKIGMGTTLYISSVKDFIILRLLRFLYLITISYTYWLVQYKIGAERSMFQMENKRVMELERMTLLEKEKLYAELNYLRLQINPHFIFNTLSFIYTEVLKYSEKASRGIILLSDIMGNVLISPGEKGEITLGQEVTHIRNLIEIHQLRFDQKLFINFESPDPAELEDVKIIPFILVTFMENVFKYGSLADSDNPVEIRLSLAGPQLYFQLKNKKNNHPSFSKSNGIGIANVKKRLSLVYPGDYLLDIVDDEAYYTVKLNLKLKC